VALVVLQVGLLGALGLLRLAATRMASAVLLEEASLRAAEVADSLSRIDARAAGETVRGPFVVTWADEGPRGTVVRAARSSDRPGTSLIEFRVP
jgi:Tfp pilus assembly protein PilV